MSHAALLIFHFEGSDIDYIMSPHNYNSDEQNEFSIAIEKEGVEAEYKRAVKSDKKKYKGMDMNEAVAEWTGYTQDEEGNFGYMTNPRGFYDWYEVGGRFKISFPLKSKSVAKELVNEALEDKSEWRNKIHEWAKLKAMNPIDACNQLGLVKNTAFVKDVDWKKAKREDGGLCFELFSEDMDMPIEYSSKKLDKMIKEWLEVEGAQVTMVDYHS